MLESLSRRTSRVLTRQANDDTEPDCRLRRTEACDGDASVNLRGRASEASIVGARVRHLLHAPHSLSLLFPAPTTGVRPEHAAARPQGGGTAKEASQASQPWSCGTAEGCKALVSALLLVKFLISHPNLVVVRCEPAVQKSGTQL